jgi:hypothetical protein
MLKRQPLPLVDFLSNLETFDLVIMQGLLVTSKEAQTITNSNWSHVGMVVVAKDLQIQGIDPETRLYWEANTADTATDLLSNTIKAGPQLVSLQDRIQHNFWIKYDGAYMARKLMINRTPEMLNQLKSVIDIAKNGTLPYSGNDQTAELSNFLQGRFYNLASTAGQYACSQLVAFTYMQLGLLTTHYVSNSYAPADFTEDVDVSLLKGAWLGREIYLDVSTIAPAPPDYNPK